MSDARAAVVIADAMWRSGSTYLASCFAASDRYMLFYEPCHEGVGRKPSSARTRDRSRDRDLRHPDIEGGYFGAYEQRDPRTGAPLRTLFAPDISARSVYGTASDRTIDYLRALVRTAQGRGRTAFLGFCRSGTQSVRIGQALGGRGLHLWRAPREQFASYRWPENDYFMTGTLLQLAFSRRYRGLARTWAPRALTAPLLIAARLLPDARTRDRYRLARSVARSLTPEESYALFYLSWLISYRSGAAMHALSFSLSGLADDQALRNRVEGEFGVRFDGLRATPGEVVDGIDYAAIEAEVAATLDALTGVPTSAVEYPPARLSSA